MKRFDRMCRKARRAWASFTALATAVTVLPAAAVLINASPAAAATQAFGYTGSAQTWTVPAGVTSVGVDVQGAKGGGEMGGLGGWVHAVIPVSPGQVLTLMVGGAGRAGAPNTPGGFNGGGGPAGYDGGSGGGASDIRIGGTGLADRVVVAGGGGGAADNASSLYGQGGVAGGTVGGSGGPGNAGRAPGAGATQSTGAALGDGQGMGCCGGGGAGGGGYYGGFSGQGATSGGTNSGGGAGSSYAYASATSVSFVPGTSVGDGSIVITTPPSTVVPSGGVTNQSSYAATGARQYYRVPEGTTQLGVVALGGGGFGSAGGLAQGFVPVVQGQVVSLFPGGGGTDTQAGYNGGGASSFWGAGAGAGRGGGGGSDVRVAGTLLTDRAIVAGGGGGGAAVIPGGAGGPGGGLSGAPGGNGDGLWRGGAGGTQSEGGINGGNYATNGSLGQGGAGGFNAGAGGGGYYGGGGGGGDSHDGGPGGGGGGSSYIGGATGASTSAAINYGAGAINVGAGFMPATPPIGGSIAASELYGGRNPSMACDCAHRQATGYPVDTASGNFWHTFDDLGIPGRGVPLGLSRTYNSGLASQASKFGYGWSFDYGMSLTIAPSTVTVNQENGSQVVYTASGSSFTAAPRVTATLQLTGGSYFLTRTDGRKFQFDSTGRLVGISDRNGYVTSVSYPSSTSMTVTDPAGRVLTFTLSSGRVASLSDPAGRTMSFSYDGSGNLTDVVDVRGGHATFTYDSSHRMLTMRSPRFYGDTTTTPTPVVTNHYDSSGRVDSQTDQLGRQTTFDYTTITGSTKVTDPKGNVTVDAYQYGELQAQTKGYGTSSAATWRYGYDPSTAARTTTTDPNGHATTATFDARGNQTGATDALGHSTSATYNAFNEPLTATDAVGGSTAFTYDTAGNLLTKDASLVTGGTTEHEVTTYAYGDPSHAGDVTSISDPLGHVTTMTYDTVGNLASTTDAMGARTTYVYNPAGMMTSSVAPKGNVPGANAAAFTTTYIRNNFGQATEVRDPLWSATTPTAHRSVNVYDADGNLTSQTDGSGNTTTSTFDAAGQLIKTTRPDGTTEQSSFNGDGSLATQTNGLSKVTSYAYDPLGRLTSSTDPLSRTTSYGYDAAGNLTSKVDPGGWCSGTPVGCTTMAYDNADRLTGTSYSDGVTPNVTYGYDNANRRTSMTDGTGTSTFAYDTLGRLTSSTNGAGATVTYGYDRANHLTTLTYPGSKTVTRAFDLAGQMTTVTDWLAHTNRFTYDVDGNWTSTISGNGMVSANTFDNADQQIGSSFDKGTKGTLAYTRSGNGSLTNQAATVLTPANDAFTYDQDNRVKTAGGTTLTYDDASQITTLIGGSTLTYDNAGQIATKTTGGVATSFSYDTRGNRTAEGTGRTYAYDQANQLKSVTTSGTTSTYAYDGAGLRASKTVGGSTKPFVYDQAEGLALVLSDGNNTYLYGPGGTPIEQVDASGNATYLHTDQLGSTRLLTNQSRATVGTYSYDAYGKETAHTGSTTPLRYAGQYADDESGLYWMRARYYDPSTAQFLNRDPIEAVTRSPYGYVDGDPLNASDPSGLCWGVGCLVGQSAIGKAITNAAGGILHGLSLGLADSWLSSQGVDICSTAYTVGIVGSLFVPGAGEEEVAGQAARIAAGHAWEKHVIERGEFRDMISTQDEFAEHIASVMRTGERKELLDGRTGYWDEVTGTLVVHDPAHVDLGTAFRPRDGRDYFDDRLK